MNRSKLGTSPFMAALYAVASGGLFGFTNPITRKRQADAARNMLGIFSSNGHHGGKHTFKLSLNQRRRVRKAERQRRKLHQRCVRRAA